MDEDEIVVLPKLTVNRALESPRQRNVPAIDPNIPGLRWEKIGTDKPLQGNQIHNAALHDYLAQGRTEFAERDLAKMRLRNITFNDYILVEQWVQNTRSQTFFRPVTLCSSDQRVADFKTVQMREAERQRAKKLAESHAAQTQVLNAVLGAKKAESLTFESSDLPLRLTELERDLSTSLHALKTPRERHGRQPDEQMQKTPHPRPEEEGEIQAKEATMDAEQARAFRESVEAAFQAKPVLKHAHDGPSDWAFETWARSAPATAASRREWGIAGKGLQDCDSVDLSRSRVRGMPSARSRGSPRKSRSRSPSKSKNEGRRSVFFPAPGGREEVISYEFEMLEREGVVPARTPRQIKVQSGRRRATPRRSSPSRENAKLWLLADNVENEIAGQAAAAQAGGVKGEAWPANWMPREGRVWNF